MVEEKPRVQKVLESLYEADGSLKPKQIAEEIGESAMNVGKDLYDLSQKRGLAEKLEDGSWQITGQGKDYIESGGQPKPEPKPKPTETTESVPSQSDLFRTIGEKLGVGAKKGDIRLDAITYYVQRTADLDNLTSVWNALTEMGVANDVKKRWIRIYAQNLPGREIPEELKEKLEGGEPEKIKAEGEGILPKPKRFSVVGGEIIGDPEGDYNFKEALQLLAQQRGVPAEAVNPLATMVEAMKMGPEMATATLTAMIPLITKEPPTKEEGGFVQTIEVLKAAGVLGKGSEVDNIVKLAEAGFLKKSGEGEGSETIRALQTEVKELKDSLQRQEMDTVKNAVLSLANQVSEMRKEMSTQGKLEGRYALMEKTITTIDNQLSGIRSDARPVLDSLAHRGGGPGPSMKSPEEKARKAKGLKEAIALEKEAHQLEDELVFGVKPS